MTLPSTTLTMATDDQLPAMHEIYAFHVSHGTGSFEEVPPSLDEMTQRWRVRESRHQPTVIAHMDNKVAGFAYAASHKDRSAYRFTVEDSVYVAPQYSGLGLGRTLLEKLIEECSERGFKQMIAVIGDSTNEASIALHKRCDFRHVGIARGVGYKFGQWLDIVYMQRALGPE